LYSTNNENTQDLSLIHKFKGYFFKDNYNQAINDIIDKKVSKIFVDTNYKEIVTIDNLPKEDLLYNHYHLSDINPIVLPLFCIIYNNYMALMVS
jgi:hypothetical protein